MGAKQSKKISVQDTSDNEHFNIIFDIKYFNIINYITKYYDIEKLNKIDDLKYYVYGYENITYDIGINIIIIIIKKNNLYIATIWHTEDYQTPFNISEIYSNIYENQITLRINKFLELLENNLKNLKQKKET
jgi:hypothetical protein